MDASTDRGDWRLLDTRDKNKQTNKQTNKKLGPWHDLLDLASSQALTLKRACIYHTNGLTPKKHNSISNAPELHLFFPEPSTWRIICLILDLSVFPLPSCLCVFLSITYESRFNQTMHVNYSRKSSSGWGWECRVGVGCGVGVGVGVAYS